MSTRTRPARVYASAEGEHESAYMVRFWNEGAYQAGIVAVVNSQDGEHVEWAAYIGAEINGQTYASTFAYLHQYGAKLDEADARHFVPEFADIWYRQ